MGKLTLGKHVQGFKQGLRTMWDFVKRVRLWDEEDECLGTYDDNFAGELKRGINRARIYR